MFRKKGPSEVEVARENELKIALSQELSKALKSLQVESLTAQKNTIIYSTDTANGVCNCLEAVFLHGLKANQLKKIANYMGLGQQAMSSPSLNFWSFAEKFTHSEVVSQLKHLGQITTEIGLCRAWVRLAMNDGLIESYVAAMIADKKMLGSFYHSTAYLRDAEQPEIMMTYIHGLMAFEFKLSYNASVLNEWTYTPLLLAGIIDSNEAPPPIIKPAPPRRSTGKSNASSDDSTPSKDSKKSRRRSKNPMEPPKFGEPSRDTYYVSSSNFTSQDVQDIKRLSQGKPGSDCSSSSHMSCPDPPNLNLSPAQYLDRKFITVSSADSTKSDTDNDSCADGAADKATEEAASSSHLQSKPRKSVEYKGYIFPEIQTGSSDKLLKELYTIDNSSADDGDGDENACIENVVDGPQGKRTDLEESWEKFYKSPVRKVQAEEVRRLQRMDSLNSELREKAILNQFEEEMDRVSNVNVTEVITNYTEPSQKDLSVRNGENICSDENNTQVEVPKVLPVESIQQENINKKADECEKTGIRLNTNIPDTFRTEDRNDTNAPQASYNDLVDTYLDRATAEAKSAPCDILTEENLKRLREVLESEGNSAAEGISGSDIDSSDSEIVVQRRTNQPRLKAKKKSPTHTSPEKLKPQLSPTEKEPVKAELSDAVADTVETIRTLENPDYLSKHRFSMPNINSPHARFANPRPSMPNITEHDVIGDTGDFLREIYDGKPILDDHAVDGQDYSEEPDDTMDEEEEKRIACLVNREPRQSLGNNLLMTVSGWSSSFESEISDTLKPLATQTTSQNVPITRPKAESFGSLLQNYTPGSSLSASIDGVLSSLPKHDTSSAISQSPCKEAVDGLMDGFEVVSSIQPLSGEEEEQFSFLNQIANERGLDSQNFQCNGCSRALGLIFGKPRVCKFDGGYYCFECHENEEYYIPAVIVHNWDFRKHQVCKKNLEFLKENEDTAFLDIDKVNPRLYDHVPEIDEIKSLRMQLVYLKSYLHSCKQSTAEDLRRLVWPREYLYDNIHLYSLADLLQVPSGGLAASIRKVIKFAMKHVYGCALCCQKGFICEFCDNPKVIYPFEIETTYRCSKCKSVYHKECKTDNRPCPKCLRRQQRQSQHYLPAKLPSADYDFHVA